MSRSHANKGTGKLRIIGGTWRSRLLPIIDQPGLRPTTDRVRETLFNWLQAQLPHAHCLDLFAGSGALGFEAASRGADEVVLIEQSLPACNNLQNNIKTLAAKNIHCYQSDALQWLKHNRQVFDLVFIDPPYASQLLKPSCQLLETSSSLTDNALIYLEHQSDEALPELPANWQIIRHKKAGQISYYLLQREQK